MRKKTRSLLAALILIILAVSAISTIIILSYSGDNRPNSTPTPSPSLHPTSSSPPPSSNPNPTPSPSPIFQIKILNKQIPPNYVMGFPVDSGLNNGMTFTLIQSSNEKFSIRFTAKLSGTVTNLVVYAYAFGGSPTVRIGLQADNEGNPTGQWVKENAFGIIQLPNSTSFRTVQLQSAVAINKNQVYHIVVEPAENPLNGAVALNTYQANGLAQPLNPDDPDIVWSDAKMNTLLYNGQSWQEQNKWPIFVVGYSDGNLEGQPYSLAPAPWALYESTYVGQTLIPASDYKVGKIAFVVSLKSNLPEDKLYYQIRDSANTILSQGVFAEPDKLTQADQWIEASLSAPVTLKAGQLYRIFLMSPQTTYMNGYYFYGHEFSFDPTIGFGGLQHQLTSSVDGGLSWGDNPDADAIFKITTTG